MKQKIVLKIQPRGRRKGLFSGCILSKSDEGDDQEFHKTVMAKIVKTSGVVLSLALQGEARDKVEVIGDGIDAAELTRYLRKKVCREVKEEQKEKERENIQTITHINPWSTTSGCCHPPSPFCDYVYYLP